ncbi:hypothetical protein PsorP6_014431 [Peronosclerospora sorghi]|uniref:Uncharacterized protein n=1 Tax=Peronosclerospora sorghi TaxID=230839 RepID=A0ACC0VH75_9STRA|nr:hypothetical protein PsorP6_014431 [Peronosclerospora sorghi]
MTVQQFMITTKLQNRIQIQFSHIQMKQTLLDLSKFTLSAKVPNKLFHGYGRKISQLFGKNVWLQ